VGTARPLDPLSFYNLTGDEAVPTPHELARSVGALGRFKAASELELRLNCRGPAKKVESWATDVSPMRVGAGTFWLRFCEELT
jgi:hypothetical protein